MHGSRLKIQLAFLLRRAKREAGVALLVSARPAGRLVARLRSVGPSFPGGLFRFLRGTRFGFPLETGKPTSFHFGDAQLWRENHFPHLISNGSLPLARQVSAFKQSHSKEMEASTL